MPQPRQSPIWSGQTAAGTLTVFLPCPLPWDCFQGAFLPESVLIFHSGLSSVPRQ